MLRDHIESHWLKAFISMFERCKIKAQEQVIILCETQSRRLNLDLARLALSDLGHHPITLEVPTPPMEPGPIIRSSGASLSLDSQPLAVAALKQADLVVDLTLEGLMHAKPTADILRAQTRVLTISNEHPEILARNMPDEALMARVKAGVKRCRATSHMHVQTAAGTDLHVDMKDAVTVGVWGWTDKPGTLAHWPAGVLVSFPAANKVDGRLVYAPGDMNLTFKRYFESQVTLEIEQDFVTKIEGQGLDARLMRDYWASFADPLAYATSHVGWGLNPHARYEALTMYDQRDLNGTELRGLAGNFLYSTGANEFAKRFTKGHFDLPMMGASIRLDRQLVVDEGRLWHN